jgi:ribonuclease HI
MLYIACDGNAENFANVLVSEGELTCKKFNNKSKAIPEIKNIVVDFKQNKVLVAETSAIIYAIEHAKKEAAPTIIFTDQRDLVEFIQGKRHLKEKTVPGKIARVLQNMLKDTNIELEYVKSHTPLVYRDFEHHLHTLADKVSGKASVSKRSEIKLRALEAAKLTKPKYVGPSLSIFDILAIKLQNFINLFV